MPKKTEKVSNPAVGEFKLPTMAELRKERAKAQEDFPDMKAVAEWLGIPEDALVKAVHKAFLNLVREDQWLAFPLMFQQVEGYR